MSSTIKKEITIKGNLLAPLEIGASAYIQSEDVKRMTSTVLCVLVNKDRYVRFETRNTIYTLVYEKA